MDDVKGYLVFLGVEWRDGYDEMLDFILGETDEYIKSFCNISVIPKGLTYTRRSIAAGRMLDRLYRSGRLTEQEFSGIVSSVKEGDTTVSYGGGTPQELFEQLVSGLLDPDKSSLLRYRRLVW